MSNDWRITKLTYQQDSVGVDSFKLIRVDTEVKDDYNNIIYDQQPPYYWQTDSNPLYDARLTEYQIDSYASHTQEYLFETHLDVAPTGPKPSWMTSIEERLVKKSAVQKQAIFSPVEDTDFIEL